MSSFDSYQHHSTPPPPFGGAPQPQGFGAPNTGSASGTDKPLTRPPLWLLFVSLGVSVVAVVLAFVLPVSLGARLGAWLVAVVAMLGICGYLVLDNRARSKGRYLTGSADTVIFGVAVGVALIAVILTSLMFGLYLGRM